MSYARLDAHRGLHWPCYDESHPGELFLHSRLWEDPVPGRVVLPPDGLVLEDVERDLIVQALERTHHNKAHAARLLHISYDTLRYQTKKYGLE